MRLIGKVAVVTGGGRGIGRAIALALAREGADMVIGDIVHRSAAGVSREMEALGRRSVAVRVDVTKSGEVSEMVQRALDGFGGIDILVNNAGIIKVARVVDMEEEDWDIVLDVNLKGVFLCSKAVIPHMIKRGNGRIINISSLAGRQGRGIGMAHYCSSKFGVIGLTQCLALELAPYNINVNAVCPGIVETAMWRELLAPEYGKMWGIPSDEAFERVVKERIPLGRPQSPDDIANVVVFLASEESRNITGQSINVDGGSHFD